MGKDACNEGDAGAVGLSPGRDNPMEKSMAGNLLQYTCLENPMDRGAWWAVVQGVTKSWIQLK